MKISLNKVIILYLILPYLIPQYFILNPTFFFMVKIWKISTGLWAGYQLLFKQKKITKITGFLVLFFTEMLLVTIYNHGSPINIIENIVICLIFDIELSREPLLFLKCLRWSLEVLIYSNFATILLFPEGMYLNPDSYSANWLLGYKNPMIRILLPSITIEIILSIFENNKISLRSLLLLVVSIFTVFLVKSSTGIFAISIFTILVFFDYRSIITNKMSLWKTFIIYLIISYSIVWLRVQEVFSYVIETVLNRNLNFTGRTEIWDNSIVLLENNIILGLGDRPEYLSTQILAPHPHNYLLYILLTGGGVGLLLLGIVIKLASSELCKFDNKPYVGVIISCIFSLFIVGISESMTATILFYPFFVMIGRLIGFNDVKFASD